MSARAGAPAPIALRAVHAAVFLGFSAAGLAAGWGEWEHLVAALTRPFHSGELPRPLTLLGGACCAIGALWIGVALTRRRAVSVGVSVAILAGACLAWGDAQRDPPLGRTAPAANLELLRVARHLQAEMVDRLQKNGELPTARAAWDAALGRLTSGPSLYRAGLRGARLPYQLSGVDGFAGLPVPPVPGMMGWWVSPDGAAFTLTPVGISDQGAPTPLPDEHGKPVVLRGTFNPDMKYPSAEAGQALPPLP